MKIPATVWNRSGDFFLQFAQTKGKVAEFITYLTKTKDNFHRRPTPPQEQGSHCEIPNSKPISESGSGDERIWGRRRTNLGAETNESGSRDERIWDGVHLYLVPHSLRGIGIETGSYKLLVCLNLWLRIQIHLILLRLLLHAKTEVSDKCVFEAQASPLFVIMRLVKSSLLVILTSV